MLHTLAYLIDVFYCGLFKVPVIWSCASNSSAVTFGYSSYSQTAVILGCCSTGASTVAIVAGSFVECLPRSAAIVLYSRDAVGGQVRALAAVLMPFL